MKYLAPLFLLLSLGFSCDGNADGEAVDFNEISRPSDVYGDSATAGADNVQLPQYFDSLSKTSRQLIDSLGWNREGIFRLDTLIFPDRFGALKADKWYYLTVSDSLVFMHWQFRDSIRTENTFFNWLDCYGKRCKSIRIGDEVNFSPRATLFLLNDKQLIFVESKQKLTPEKYISLLKELKVGESWKYAIIQAPRGKAKWKTVNRDGELLDFKKDPAGSIE